MKRRPRIYYSESQKALMWERWKQGATLHEIGKLFDRARQILAASGCSAIKSNSRLCAALLTPTSATSNPGWRASPR
jgi:hypothetical protein